ncbi:TatD family hydrolase [Prodigiosinella confusarubida]|uniref:TatD family hydrolase n=1 Tax=Serratia sp. (strain ATCC 39006) TaxID=104623 RepID=UPI00039222A4|nr:TatD family hydrolase [Serratia sp. ATCC 39006]
MQTRSDTAINIAQSASVAFIDTHCHFDFPPFAADEVASLHRATQAGVEGIIIPAVESHYFDRILHLAHSWPVLYAALGLHPLYIERHHEADLALLESRLHDRDHRLVAVGEIGLDLYRDDPQFERQCVFLNAQLELAKQYDLPVILHSRRSHNPLAALLKQAQLPRTGVVHGFSGSFEQAQAFIRLGYYIGVGGVITYPRANKTRQAIARLPLDRLLLETDAPDMPVCGYQGEPNRPERIRSVFQSLCDLRTESPEVLAAVLYENTHRLFPLTVSCQ